MYGCCDMKYYVVRFLVVVPWQPGGRWVVGAAAWLAGYILVVIKLYLIFIVRQSRGCNEMKYHVVRFLVVVLCG